MNTFQTYQYESDDLARRHEVARHADQQVRQILPRREPACRAVDQPRRRYDGADHALDDPLAAELTAPRAVVLAQRASANAGVDASSICSRGRRAARRHAARRRSLAGERIEEVGGVADERRAGRPGLSGIRCERTGRDNRRDALGAGKAQREARLIEQPAASRNSARFHSTSRATGPRERPRRRWSDLRRRRRCRRSRPVRRASRHARRHPGRRGSA